jgi:hypothetical protein
MSPLEIDYCAEGQSDMVIAKKLIVVAGHAPGRAYPRENGAQGKAAVDRLVAGLNAGAAFGNPVLVLRDLDGADCPSSLIQQLLTKRNPRMLLRIAVRSADAWLMADRKAYAIFCGVKERQIPETIEDLARPKSIIEDWLDNGKALHLARFVTEQRRLGMPNYQIIGQWHAEFARSDWDPLRAANSGRCPSLQKAIVRIQHVS